MMRASLVFMLMLCPLLTAAPATQPVELAEVTTSEELTKQPGIAVPGVGKVRLGISPADAGLGPVRVVYCLQESADHREIERLHRGGSFGQERELGPLRVAWQWEKELVLVEQINRAARLNPKLPATFMTSVPLGQAGKVTITVYTPAGQVVAAKTLTVDEPKSAWLEFAAWPEDADPEKPFRVEPLAEQVVPRMESAQLPVSKGDLLGIGKSSLKLALKDNALTINAGEQQLIDQPTEHLAARWWVNGKPRELVRVIKCGAVMRAAAVQTATKMQVTFGLPGNLGELKAGDKVALQVLYSADGFERVSNLTAMKQFAQTGDLSPVMAISDKLDILVTEQMLKDRKAE